jgi:cell division protein FtsI/penicillin-binding protein 2
MFRRKKEKNNEIIFNTSSKMNFNDLLEKPLEKKIFTFYIFFIIFIFIIFTFKLYSMQINGYKKYLEKSKDNFIKTEVLFSDRGVVFDKNGKELI